MKLELEVRAEPIEGTDKFTATVYCVLEDSKLDPVKIWTWSKDSELQEGFASAWAAETVCAIDFCRLLEQTLTTVDSLVESKSKIVVTK